MRLLLDTHVLLFLLTEPERLSESAVGALESRDNDLVVSSASAWEIAIKHGLGKLDLPSEPAEFVPGALAHYGMELLPVDLSHALEVGRLPQHHRDPFDRLLIAQAQLEGMVLVTRDAQMSAYDVEVLRA